MELDLRDYVCNYIENRIESIKDYEYSTIDDLRELNHLESLSDEQIDKITEKVENDNELKQKLSELIDYYLYH
ncbi:MAG: hypothetical protein II625_09030 [Bacilli bacterium]|nr:hypothetical protein [Bacilli bacterium]